MDYIPTVCGTGICWRTGSYNNTGTRFDLVESHHKGSNATHNPKLPSTQSTLGSKG